MLTKLRYVMTGNVPAKKLFTVGLLEGAYIVKEHIFCLEGSGNAGW